MRQTRLSLDPTVRVETLLRLFTVALAALLVVLERSGAAPDVALFGAGYVILSLAIWLFASRLEPLPLAPMLALLDVAAATAFIVLLQPARLPAWPLYLFPLGIAAPSGRGAAIVAGGLSVLAYLGAAVFFGSLDASQLWPVGVIGAATLAVGLLSDQWQIERKERRAWREVVAAARAVLGAEEPRLAATLVVEQARRLTRADHAGLWWWAGTGALTVAEHSARVPEAWLRLEQVSPSAERRLHRGRIELADLIPDFRGAAGEAVLLRRQESVLALLIVSWNKPPSDRAARLQALRAFASWAAEALARARSNAATSEEMRRERVLRQAAAALAATLDESELQHAVVEAASAGVGGAACLVERSSGRALAGDDKLAHTLVKLVIGGESPRPVSAGREDAPFVTFVGPEVALLVTRDASLLDQGDRAWLEHLAQVARHALERVATHEQLRQALRAKDELISLVGHELRTPLTSIHGYSQMMARQLRTVEQQVEQLNRLIGDLMDASQIEGGQLKIQWDLVDLTELARAAAERFRARHPGRLLRMGLVESSVVEGDEARLGQVLDNLLDNAAKFSQPEGEIDLSVDGDQRSATVSVRDYGAGIASEHLPHLFDRFYRAPGATSMRVRGFGLGLSIVRDLVAAHGGHVSAESDGPGHGSTFSVALPRAAVNGSGRKLNARAS